MRLICESDVCLLVDSTMGDLDGERLKGDLDGVAILLTPTRQCWTGLIGTPGALTRATAGAIGSCGTEVLGWSDGTIGGGAGQSWCSSSSRARA